MFNIEQAMKAQMESRGIALLFFNAAPRSLYPGKDPALIV
jgi:hypothetical protein